LIEAPLIVAIGRGIKAPEIFASRAGCEERGRRNRRVASDLRRRLPDGSGQIGSSCKTVAPKLILALELALPFNTSSH